MEETNSTVHNQSTEQLVKSLKNRISGFRPEVTPGICDVCNRSINSSGSGTDYAYVYADYYEGTWAIKGVYCDAHKNQLDERELVEAVVKCELGPSVNGDGEFYPLYNPEVYQLNTGDGAEIRR